MSRQTRQQRRDRRAQTSPATGRRAPARQPALAADGAGDRGAPPARPTERSRSGPFAFLGESWAELRKVEWPGQQQLIQGTVVVLIACLVVGAYLYANDQVWQRIVHRFLIK